MEKKVFLVRPDGRFSEDPQMCQMFTACLSPVPSLSQCSSSLQKDTRDPLLSRYCLDKPLSKAWQAVRKHAFTQ